MTQLGINFDGPHLTRRDQRRLATNQSAVYRLMLDGQWRTLAEIAEAVDCSEAGASARLRDLRKPKVASVYPNGGVERRRITDGVHEYRMRRAGE